jgi:phospholipase C
MDNRRQFLAKAAFLTGAAGFPISLMSAIERARAIEPEQQSTFWDAEHVVILMQENRSFDHAYGTLRGVRGYNDSRAIKLANGNPVWVQTDPAGKSYVPFRLNIKDTRSTWMGCLPHNWTDQTDARNEGRYDRWLEVKRSGHGRYADMPLTLGYYNREDIPFYYAFADAFTICDQHFCSSLTGTTPNRCYLWSGTIRAEQNPKSPAFNLNSDADHFTNVNWPTFPERLEDLGVSWKVYQNEINVGVGFTEEEDRWLSNFGDNPLEYFTQFNVRMTPAHRAYLEASFKALPERIAKLKGQLESQNSSADRQKLAELLKEQSDLLKQIAKGRLKWNDRSFEQLSQREKNLMQKAFCTNTGDPHYRELTEISYRDGDRTRNVRVPKGDLLHQLREDVAKGTLPTVSWIVAPEQYSDHPGAAWFGSWYIAEVLDALTQNPAVWQKTIFMLTYDENDGYFDHVPPFVAPDPRRPETGRVTDDIDAGLEYVTREDELKRKSAGAARDSSIGLGYRVPLVIASPWSRGGYVCSQVFDHTSPLQFLETLLTKKLGKEVRETNISAWRRAVCGDLTSAFRPASAPSSDRVPYPSRDEFVEQIHRAQYKRLPSGYKQLTDQEIAESRKSLASLSQMPQQEPGLRPSCALPYELAVDGSLTQDRKQFQIQFEARNQQFGEQSAGSPFTAYAYLKPGDLHVRNYAVSPGRKVEDSWALGEFENGRYELAVYGPNGFYREFRGDSSDPPVDVSCGYDLLKSKKSESFGSAIIQFKNRGVQALSIEILDAYNHTPQRATIAPGEVLSLASDTCGSFGWYDLQVRVDAYERFVKRYAGRLECGKSSFSDPAMDSPHA